MSQNASVSSLSKKQLSALEALALGATKSAVAGHVGVNRKTLYRWLQKPEFRQAIAEFRRELYDCAVGSAVGSSPTAIRVLRDVAMDTTKPAGVRVQAAGKLLEFAHRSVFEAGLEERIRALEALEGDQWAEG